MSSAVAVERPLASARRLILPLALAQFICSFAGSNMNVMISDISDDLDTTVKGVQTAITLFLLIMAILMIPCSKLTDRWGRKRCFTVGLTLYGIGALVSAVSPNLGVLILGNSVFEGVGTALLIPPVYILATLVVQRRDLARLGFRRDQRAGRHRRGGRSADRRRDHDGNQLAGRVRLSGRWSSRRSCCSAAAWSIRCRADPTRPFDAVGAILSAVGMFCVVFGILQAGSNNALLRDLPRDRSRLPGSRSSSTSGAASAPARSRCSRPGCSGTGPATSPSSPRTSSG